MQRESWDPGHPHHLPLLLRPSSNQQKTHCPWSTQHHPGCCRAQGQFQEVISGERVNEWTYLPGNCGALLGDARDCWCHKGHQTCGYKLAGIELFHCPTVFPCHDQTAPLSTQASSWSNGGWHPQDWGTQAGIWSRSTRRNKLSGKPLQAESWTWVEQVRGEKELFGNGYRVEQKAMGT